MPRSVNNSLLVVDGVSYKKNVSGNMLVNVAAPPPKTPTRRPKLVTIGGVDFVVDPVRKKLVRKDVHGEIEGSPTPKRTPKHVVVNGTSYVRSKSGNLILQKEPLARPTPRPWTNTQHKYRHPGQPARYCQFYRFGILFKCGEEIENEDCHYLHVKYSEKAPICRPFATEGYCEAGGQCQNKHMFKCPDFAAGKCENPKCRLPHETKARDDGGSANRSLQRHGAEERVSADEEEDQLPIRPAFEYETADEDEELDTESDAGVALSEYEQNDMIRLDSDQEMISLDGGDEWEEEDDEEEESGEEGGDDDHDAISPLNVVVDLTDDD
ncbi:hypothetical protein HK104_009023 [Borealophlyctis nickersoniae]|nr:hypothetical protein HK104_009023 [Borealophlyctis nickersoniae]